MKTLSTVSFQKTSAQAIKPTQLVTLKRMKHIAEIKFVENSSDNLSNIKKLSKTNFINLETGELGEYQLSENRSQNVSSFKKTTRRIRDLINNNFTGGKNEIMVTLTYRDNVTDPKQFYEDFKKFWQKFKRRIGSNLDYLNIVEPQERGAWHGHVLIRRNDGKTLYIHNNEVSKMWGQPITKTKRLEQVDNIGAYLTAYLSDIELTDDNLTNYLDKPIKVKELVTEDGKQKKYVKGGRIHLYPSGMNIVRHSKGIQYPDEIKMTYEKAKKIIGSRTPDYSSTVTISDDTKQLNSITYEHYNLKRTK